MVVELELPVPREFTLVVFVSLLLDDEAGSLSLTIVVLLSFFSPGGFATVVSFCSQAANRAAPAKMQMIFFIAG